MQCEEEHLNAPIQQTATRTDHKFTLPYHSLSSLHAPVTAISHALYLSSAVLFPVPKALLTT